MRRSIRHLLTALAIVLAVTASVLGYSLAQKSEAAQTLPAGFSIREMPTGQESLPTDIAYTPDDGYISAGKSGHLAYVSPTGEVTPLGDLPVRDDQDLGLTGIAVAPDFATSGFLYVSRTTDTGVMRLGRFTVEFSAGAAPKPVGLGTEKVLLEAPARTAVHGISGVTAAADGTVWVSIGDSADFIRVDPLALDAQNLESPYGKLLHITKDGAGVPTNPYYQAATPNSWSSKVYAKGFRSPFRFTLDPVTGAPIVGDVGWNWWEEINMVKAGDNLGWPCWEGNDTTGGYRDLPGCFGVTATKPLHTYSHAGKNASVTGGIVYTGTSYPEQYRGTYFFADYALQTVSNMKLRDAQGKLLPAPVPTVFSKETVPMQEGGGNCIVKFAAAPNGDLVMADICANVLKRLVYEGGNRAPVAKATTTVEPATLTVQFDASASTDLDGDVLTYEWDFGDGQEGTGVTASHQYEEAGDYTATLTVKDPGGKVGTYKLKVVPANHAPAIEWLEAPAENHKFKVNEALVIKANATDADELELDGTPKQLSVRWESVMFHCYGGGCHSHPSKAYTGPEYSVPFEDHGDDTHMQITAFVTDANGVTTQRSYKAWPKLMNLTVRSTTPAAVTINSRDAQTVPVTVGSKLSLVAAETAIDGVATFKSWGDGGARVHDMTMPDRDVELAVTYETPIDKRLATDKPAATKLGAPLGAETGNATLRTREFQNGRMYWTPQSGAHIVEGGILTNYLANGGPGFLGAPTTDELTTADGVGRYNNFEYGASTYWTPQTGAHTVHGAIYTKWAQLGLERGPMGYPTTDELGTSKPGGRYNNFQNGPITWSGWTGAHAVYGAILGKYGELKWDWGVLGFPTTDELPTGRPGGRFNEFEGGTIVWSPGTGAQMVMGSIRTKWGEYGWDNGRLGFPSSSETATPRVYGRFNTFQFGLVYWSPASGSHAVYGAIQTRYGQLGWENSYLGFPTTEEFGVPNGRRQNFQKGYIVWDARTGAVVDRRN
ncbi:PQQ-dependent sugar dehydrogenase [Streptomycetaceae bacterium NBC_01309]